MRGGTDLYFIQMNVTGAIKIGRSKHVDKRRAQLQVGAPHKLKVLLVLPRMGHIEKDLHRRLASHKLRYGSGEWFGPDCLWDLPVDLYDKLDLEMLDWWQR